MTYARLMCLVVGLGLVGPNIQAAPLEKKASSRTVLIVPFMRQINTPEWISLSLAQGLIHLTAEAGRDNFLTLKQLDAVLRNRDIPMTDASDPEAGLPLARAPRQQAVELVGEGLAVRLAERRGTARVDAAGAQGVHEVAHVEALADVFGGI